MATIDVKKTSHVCGKITLDKQVTIPEYLGVLAEHYGEHVTDYRARLFDKDGTPITGSIAALMQYKLRDGDKLEVENKEPVSKFQCIGQVIQKTDNSRCGCKCDKTKPLSDFENIMEQAAKSTTTVDKILRASALCLAYQHDVMHMSKEECMKRADFLSEVLHTLDIVK